MIVNDSFFRYFLRQFKTRKTNVCTWKSIKKIGDTALFFNRIEKNLAIFWSTISSRSRILILLVVFQVIFVLVQKTSLVEISTEIYNVGCNKSLQVQQTRVDDSKMPKAT